MPDLRRLTACLTCFTMKNLHVPFQCYRNREVTVRVASGNVFQQLVYQVLCRRSLFACRSPEGPDSSELFAEKTIPECRRNPSWVVKVRRGISIRVQLLLIHGNRS